MCWFVGICKSHCFYAAHCATESFLIMDQNMWEADCAPLGVFPKYSVFRWFSFLWSRFLNFIECRAFILNSARIAQDIWILQVEVDLCPEVKCSFLCNDFHGTRNPSLAFSEDVNQISPKSVKKYKVYRHNIIPLLNKVWLSLHWFSRSSESLSKFLWTSPMPNFIRMKRKVLNIG